MSDDAGTVRWGIAGPGWVASDFFAPAILERPGSRITACLGSSLAKGEAFARRFHVSRVHQDMDAFVADPDVDAVYVALPNAQHHGAVLAAARAGKHVLCEKPFALTLGQAQEMTRACREAGVTLRIAHQLRLDAALGHARSVVASGGLGRIVSIALERASGLVSRPAWREDATQSGVIYDVGVHLLDLVQWLSGERYLEVCAFTHPDRRLGVPDDTVTVLGRLEGGCQAVIRATREVASAENNLVIQGTEASLSTSALRFSAEHVVRVHDRTSSEDTRFAAGNTYAAEVAAFEDLLRGKESALPDGTEGARTVAVTEAVLTAISQRRVVSVPDAPA